MKLNLIYYIAPFKHNDEWRKNVAQLRRRLPIFDGRRVVVVATGTLCDPLREVAAEFEDCEVFAQPNNPQLGDTAGFVRGLDEMRHTNAEGATFFAHAKGVTRPGQPVISWWRNFLYRACLDDPAAVVAALQRYPVTGAMRRTTHTGEFPDGMPAPSWYYAGSFFWFRNADALPFGTSRIVQTRWGTERWPSCMWPLNESHCLAMDNCGQPYHATTHTVRIDD